MTCTVKGCKGQGKGLGMIETPVGDRPVVAVGCFTGYFESKSHRLTSEGQNRNTVYSMVLDLMDPARITPESREESTCLRLMARNRNRVFS